MNKDELIRIFNTQLHLDLPAVTTENVLEQKLLEFIEHLINTEFEKLIQILYKTYINERDLKKKLEEEPLKSAASIITNMLIVRELEKIESRKKNKKRSNTNDADSW